MKSLSWLLLSSFITRTYTQNVNDILRRPLRAGQVSQLRWTFDYTLVHDNVYRIGLPEGLQSILLNYAEKMNITTMMRKWTAG